MFSVNLRFLRFLGAATVVVIADYFLVLTDCIVAGRVLGEVALAAMNLLMPVFSAVTFFIWLLASGMSTLCTLAIKKGDRDRTARLSGQGLLSAALLGVVLVSGLWGLEGPYLAFMAPDETITAFSGQYWKWYPCSVILQAVDLMLLYLVFVQGGEFICICSYALQVAVNAVASYGLCLRFGMSGISLGSVCAFAAGIVLLLPWAFFPCRRLAVKAAAFDIRSVGRALKSSCAESFVWIFHAVLFFAIIKYVLFFWDSVSLAVCAVVFCVIRLTAFFGGVGVALRPLELAVRKEGRGTVDVARLVGLMAAASFAVMLVAALLFFVAPELLIGLFGIESSDLISGSKFAARITVGGLVLGGLVAVLPLLRRVSASKIPEAPISYLQDYVLERLADEPGSPMFNLAKLFRLRKGIDLERLSAALVASGRAHRALTTVLRRGADGDVVQRQELGPSAVRCPIVKADERELLARKSELVRSFRLFGTCLFEAKIFDCGDSAYLLSDFHHLICDGYSFPLILEDAHRVWNGETLESDAYYDVLARREERAALPLAVAGRNFMRELLKGKSFATLPTEDFRGASGYGALEIDLVLPDGFAAFLTSRRATRHHLFLAATVLALSKFNRADDVLVDWVFHGRVSKDELKTVGAFMVDLPLVAEGCSGMTASDLFAHVKRATFNGIRGVNCYRSVADCNPTGQERLTFIYQDGWGELMTPGPVRADGPYAWMIEETIPLSAPAAASENPFNVEIMEHRDATRLFLEYDAGRYSEASVRRYAALFRESLDWLLNT